MLSQTFSSPIDAPATDLTSWHFRKGAFERLGPPWAMPEVIHDLESLRPGAQTTIKVPQGPISTEWISEISNVTENSFTDIQLKGPFQAWTHYHRFQARTENQSQLLDEIHCQPPLGTFGHLTEGYIRQQLESVFSWRHQITQQDLTRRFQLGWERPSRLLISGATGLVGSVLTHLATTQGHRVTVLTRNAKKETDLEWAPSEGKLELTRTERPDAVIHLAGANITGSRWTPEYKKILRESRTKSTRLLAESLANLPPDQRPHTLVCASGISGLPNNGQPYSEDHPLDTSSFLGQVVKEWEAAADPARRAGIRVVHVRISPVLDPRGGVLKKLLPLFKLGGGGPFGSPSAEFPWISLEDLSDILLRACFDERYQGPIHACTPQNPNRRQFAHALGKALNRPAIIPAPATAVRLALGKEMANETALANLHPLPTKLAALNYPYRFPDLQPALDAMLGKTQLPPI